MWCVVWFESSDYRCLLPVLSHSSKQREPDFPLPKSSPRSLIINSPSFLTFNHNVVYSTRIDPMVWTNQIISYKMCAQEHFSCFYILPTSCQPSFILHLDIKQCFNQYGCKNKTCTSSKGYIVIYVLLILLCTCLNHIIPEKYHHLVILKVLHNK